MCALGNSPASYASETLIHLMSEQHPIDIVEVAVGFIIALFIEFIRVKSFVVKFLGVFKDQSVSSPSSLGMRTSPYIPPCQSHATFLGNLLTRRYLWRGRLRQQPYEPPREKYSRRCAGEKP